MYHVSAIRINGIIPSQQKKNKQEYQLALCRTARVFFSRRLNERSDLSGN